MKAKIGSFLNCIAIVLAICIFCGNIVYASATVNRVLYSDDYFGGDYAFALQLKNSLSATGRSSSVGARPTSSYGINTNLTNSRTLYISTHGKSTGSELVLDTSSSYCPSDIPVISDDLFVFYSACYSAKTSGTLGNLCSTTVAQGVDACIGYSGSVSINSSRCFEAYFYDRAMNYNDTIYYSYYKAKIYTNGIYGSDTGNAGNLACFYGNGSINIR